MTKREQMAAEKADAVKMLRRFCRPGTTVYGIVRAVSRSGMSRTIDFYAFRGGERLYLSGYMAAVLGMTRTREGAIKVDGGGMDMVFGTVFNLSYAIHGGPGSRPSATDIARGKAAPLATLRPGYTLRAESL